MDEELTAISRIICNFTSHWRSKDFTLGFNIASQDFSVYREYYVLFSLGFWQLALGVKI